MSFIITIYASAHLYKITFNVSSYTWTCSKEYSVSFAVTWVDGPPNNSSQRIPGAVIKPIVKFVEALLSQEAGCAVVEIPEIDDANKQQMLFPIQNTQQWRPV